eukprot:s4856_g1.t1
MKLKTKKKQSKRKSRPVPVDDDDDDDGYAPGIPYDGPMLETDDEGEAPRLVPDPDPDPEDPDPDPEGHGLEEERRDEEDDDDIEVDVIKGESRVAKRGTLKREAKSLEHKLTHKYTNPYCDSCVRAKMETSQTRRGAYRRELKKFGGLITFDAVNTDKIHDDTLILEEKVLVLRDCFTGLVGAYPSSRMTSDDVVRAVQQFIGSKKVRELYSDNAPLFDDAMYEMKILVDHSLPGRPQTNSIAERTNQFILTTTCTCPLEAGFPPCFWRTAIPCVCHPLNTEHNDDDISAWCKLHGSEFKGKLVPSGAMVNYKPSSSRDVGQSHKFDPDAIPGVFAAYHAGPGMHWPRQYKVWPLDEFVNQNLGYDASKPEKRLLKPHLTEKLAMVTPLTFPLKAEYERMNTTLEGMKERDRLGGEPSKLPAPDDGGGDGDELEDQDDEVKRMVPETVDTTREGEEY